MSLAAKGLKKPKAFALQVPTMEYRKLGKSSVEVSAVSLGCWTMGGLNWIDGHANGWANVDEDEILAAIKIGIDAGVNHFDNADVYGNGRAERMLARCLEKLGLKSEDFVIATKMGHHKGTAANAYEHAHIRHQCEQSLINLKRDYIDLYYFHHGDYGERLEEAAATMHALQAEGKVRLIGQSAYSLADFERSVPVLKPDVLQSWASAMDDQHIKPDGGLSKLMRAEGMSFVAFGTLGHGLLLDKFDPENMPTFEPGDHRLASQGFKPENLRRLKPKLAEMKARFGERAEDLAGTAISYVVSHPRVACAIAGFRNERQVSCNLAGAGKALSSEDLAWITNLFAA